ncbi:MAG: UDP-glucose--hexose-1-phosphate uridylyltransferase [Firmicutes bacterium]|nr:UDP-glucose--hexose-1-phosphate uridylyltransferase [Bacillota bacterium]
MAVQSERAVLGAIERLLAFTRVSGLLSAADMNFARNQLLYALRLSEPMPEILPNDTPLPPTAAPMLSVLVQAAAERGLIDDDAFSREQFCSHLMNLLTPPPSRVQALYRAKLEAEGAEKATDWFYALCRANGSIHADETARNVAFSAPSPYGAMEITINLSKPEKDPREIAKLKTEKASGYPLCMLCVENEGYAGRPGYPSHETLRTVSVSLCGEAWRLQYSPYAYYPEHCIALNERHIPMSINRRSFSLLLDFVSQYPHYFMGSNADLPIVGGSILHHDHFQGGRHVFPMELAKPYQTVSHPAYPSVLIELVRWPMTCIRLTCKEQEPLIRLADSLLTAWRGYDDASQGILHETEGEPHNTITPIARKARNGAYRLSLVLRNNRTTKEHPLGIFHPHGELHHIKKENIGLIEVMGLFILPGRLREELEDIAAYLTGGRPLVPFEENDPLFKHYPWITALVRAHGTSLTPDEARRALTDALADKCVAVLEQAGVFKPTRDGDAALLRFLATTGIAAG